MENWADCAATYRWEERQIPQNHPLWAIRALPDETLHDPSLDFNGVCGWRLSTECSGATGARPDAKNPTLRSRVSGGSSHSSIQTRCLAGL
jgi:hypothetical protein